MLRPVLLQRLPVAELFRAPVARERLGLVEMDPVVVPVQVEGLARAVLAHVALEHLGQVLSVGVAEVEDRVGVGLPVALPHVLEQRLRRRRLEVAVGADESLSRRRRRFFAGSFRFRLSEELEEDVRLPDVEAKHLKHGWALVVVGSPSYLVFSGCGFMSQREELSYAFKLFRGLWQRQLL